ncbi:transposase, mutator-like family protein [Leptospira inadai serovar Lyme str. 10]|uniref:Transposase, mutator-like family protein n=1 Tax=Leptospira inadai serovar Lyme str. 10 TaxID=1049790 RepID=V6H8R1_9LEPT|nr:transposase, mutator-like family protein [Leptospira inadai serovar Lyme str. 10]
MYLAYMDFPSEHWRKIRTNNPLERIIKEIKRRTRVVGVFPFYVPVISDFLP